MSLYSKQLASSQVYVRNQKDKDGSRDRENRVSAPDRGVVAATATAARGGGPRAAGHGRRSGGGGFERRGDNGRGRRQSNSCCAFFYVKVHARDGLAEVARRDVVCEVENGDADVGLAQIRGRRERGRLREQQENVAMRSTALWRSRSSIIGDCHATRSRHVQRRGSILQGDAVDEPVARLPDRLIRADDVGVSHDERKVPRERTAAGGCGHDGDFGCGGHLLFGQVLAWRDGADTGEGDGHDGGGSEGREEGGDEVSIGEMSLDSSDAKGGVIGGLGINEGAQERKSESGGEEEHGGILKNELMPWRYTHMVTICHACQSF